MIDCFRYWLYGDKVLPENVMQREGDNRVRGWFPRQIALDVMLAEERWVSN